MNKLGKSFRRKPPAPSLAGPERLVCCASKRGDEVLQGAMSHAELRNYEPARRGDVCGFMTTRNRFLSRDEAKVVGEQAGQVPPGQRRELLSSDVNWNAKR